jgi:hypothetical protein
MADEDGGAPLTDSRFRVHGEVRLRGELEDNYQDFNDDGGFASSIVSGGIDDDTIEYFPYRVRLAVEGQISETVFGQMQIQVGDLLGQDREQQGVVTTHENDGELVLYTGFIHWNRIGNTSWNMRFGRQEITVGNEFLFGDLDYYNGTSFDGWRTHWDGDPVEFQFFWAQTNETLGGHIETNVFGASLDGSVDRGDEWSLYSNWIMEEDSPSGRDTMNLFVLGARWTRLEGEGSHLLWNLEIAYQDGRIGNPSILITDFQRPDYGLFTGATDDDTFITAWGAEGRFGYNWNQGENDHQFYVHGYFASGDKDHGNHKDDENFRPLFQDFHNRLGRADMVQGTNIRSYGVAWEGTFGDKHAAGIDGMFFFIDEPGNADTCLTLGPGDFMLNPRDSLRQDCVLDPGMDEFQGWFIPADETLTDSGLDAEDELGQELDLWYDYAINDYLTFGAELSVFFPGDAITQMRDISDWQMLAPDGSESISFNSDHAPTLLAAQSRFLLSDDPAVRLSAQFRLRF